MVERNSIFSRGKLQGFEGRRVLVLTAPVPGAARKRPRGCRKPRGPINSQEAEGLGAGRTGHGAHMSYETRPTNPDAAGREEQSTGRMAARGLLWLVIAIAIV